MLFDWSGVTVYSSSGYSSGESPDRSKRAGFLVVGLRVSQVDLGCAGSHRRVDEERQLRHPSLAEKMVEGPHELLGAADGKGRNQQHPLRHGDLVDRRHQLVHPFGVGSVLPIPVGRLDHHEVGLLETGGITQDRGFVPSQVTREDDVGGRGSVEAQFDHGRAEDVAGVVEHGG